MPTEAPRVDQTGGPGARLVGLVFLVGAALSFGTALLTPGPHDATNGSPLPGVVSAYVKMARHPLSFPDDQTGYRLLTPLIVHILPMSVRTGYTLVTVVALAATAAALFALLCRFAPVDIAGVVTVCLLGTGAVRDALLVRQVVDPISLLAIVLTMYLLVAGKHWWLGPVVALAVLNHDANLSLLVPVLAVGTARRFAPRAAWVAALALPIATYALVHFTPVVFGHVPPAYHYLSLANVRTVVHREVHVFGNLPVAITDGLLLMSLGPLWLGLAHLPKASPRLKLLSTYLLTLPYNAAIGSDWDRVGTFVFPVVMALCAEWLGEGRRHKGLREVAGAPGRAGTALFEDGLAGGSGRRVRAT
jgi:hypothetical protein